MSHSSGDKVLSHTNQAGRTQTLASSGYNDRKGNPENPTSSNDQISPDCDGNKGPPLANQVNENPSLISDDHDNRKGHQGKPNVNDCGTSSDSDENKTQPSTDQVQRKQTSTPHRPTVHNDQSAPYFARIKMRLLASQLSKDQTLVEDFSSNTQDPLYQNPPGTNIQITTKQLYLYASKYISFITCSILY